MAVLVFDADDTLWENNVRFNRAVDDYLAWVAHPTLDAAAIRAILRDVERANVVAHGFGAHVFLRTLHDTFERLQQRPATAAERASIDALGAAVADHRVELVPEVAATLDDLGRRHDLVLLTQGEQAAQQRKIDASGLAGHFSSRHIVPRKNVGVYRGLTASLALDPAATWMIGNSPKTDVLPARAAGWRAVFLPNPHTWDYDKVELDPADDGVLTLRAFPELLAHF